MSAPRPIDPEDIRAGMRIRAEHTSPMGTKRSVEGVVMNDHGAGVHFYDGMSAPGPDAAYTLLEDVPAPPRPDGIYRLNHGGFREWRNGKWWDGFGNEIGHKLFGLEGPVLVPTVPEGHKTYDPAEGVVISRDFAEAAAEGMAQHGEKHDCTCGSRATSLRAVLRGESA